MVPPTELPPIPHEDITGNHGPAPSAPAAREEKQDEGGFTLPGGIKVTGWAAVAVFLFGGGTGAVGSGAIDVFGLKALRAEVLQLEAEHEALKAEVVELRHQRDLDRLTCCAKVP